jgi:hypothetical protein
VGLPNAPVAAWRRDIGARVRREASRSFLALDRQVRLE